VATLAVVSKDAGGGFADPRHGARLLQQTPQYCRSARRSLAERDTKLTV
jgi:hypothetical protein